MDLSESRFTFFNACNFFFRQPSCGNCGLRWAVFEGLQGTSHFNRSWLLS